MIYVRMGRMRTLRRAGQFRSPLQGTDLLSFHGFGRGLMHEVLALSPRATSAILVMASKACSAWRHRIDATGRGLDPS